ncbi:MAG: hypothetical protein WC734_04285 [Patescibacteria group bacterium]
MKRYIDPVSNCVLGVGAPLLISGGVMVTRLLVKMGGFWSIIGALTTLVGCLFLLVIFIILMHDTVLPGIRRMRSKEPRAPDSAPWTRRNTP